MIEGKLKLGETQTEWVDIFLIDKDGEQFLIAENVSMIYAAEIVRRWDFGRGDIVPILGTTVPNLGTA